jgi:signal transduction histidine kinase
MMLLGINGGIFFFAGGLGFVLAGRTLKPIKIMVDEQNRFISDASHELKTPLTSLKSAFEVYLRDKKRTQKDIEARRQAMDTLTLLFNLDDSSAKARA